MKRLAPMAFAFLSGCSLIAGSGFTECRVDVDCGTRNPCVEGFCLTLPDDCQRSEGSFRTTDRLAVGVISPFTTSGAMPDVAKQTNLSAINVAAKLINTSGGVGGTALDLYSCDTKGSPDAGAVLATWLVSNLQVPALLVATSNTTAAVNDAVGSKSPFGPKAPAIISWTATSPSFVSPFVNGAKVYRIPSSDTQQATLLRALAVKVRSDIGASARDAGIGLLYERGDYGQTFKDNFTAELGQAGAPLSTRDFSPLDGPDAGRTALLSLTADGGIGGSVIVVISFPPSIAGIADEAAKDVRLRRDAGHRFLFSDSARNPSLLQATDAGLTILIGAEGTAPVQNAGLASAWFPAAFADAGMLGSPFESSFSAHGFDSVFVLALSAAWARRDGGTVRGAALTAGIAQLNNGAVAETSIEQYRTLIGTLLDGGTVNISGASGDLNFDTGGSPLGKYEHWRFEADGGFKVLAIIP